MVDVRETDPAIADGLNGLYRRHATWLDRQLRAFVGPDRAADIVQETYLRLSSRQATDIRHPKAFLFRVAMNLIRDDSRRLKRERAFQRQLALPDPTSADQIDVLMLKQVILTMPSLYRDVFVLSRFEGKSYAEIAQARGVSIKAIEWRMSKALLHCAAQLDG